MGNGYIQQSDINRIDKPLMQISRRQSFGQVFDDFVSLLYHSFLLPLNEEQSAEFNEEHLAIKSRYNAQELVLFSEAISTFLTIQRDYLPKDIFSWYDVLGSYYEWAGSQHKAKAMGQFFTPKHVCDLMTMLVNPALKPHRLRIENREDDLSIFMEFLTKAKDYDKPYTIWEAIKIADPACGSGRCLLSANAYNKFPQFPPYMSGVDLDKICAKMSLVNFALHGCWGEIIHGNSLSIKYYNSWRVAPAHIHKIHDQEGRPLISPIICKIPVEDTFDYISWKAQLEKHRENKKQLKKSEIEKSWTKKTEDSYHSKKRLTTENLLEKYKNEKPKRKKSKKDNNDTEQFTLF